MSDELKHDVLRHTAQVVSAHLGHNKVPNELVPELIRSVYQALATADKPTEPQAVRAEPAVPIRKSVFPDYIVCLEDGAKMKMLKRYLLKRYGLSPADYRAKWGLPADYPMVAPNYSSHRSGLAKQLGLGQKQAAPETEEPSTDPVAEEPKTSTKGARKRRNGEQQA